MLKKQSDLFWLKEIHSQILQQALNDLDLAFQNFFRGLKQKVKIGYPHFKCKGMKDSFRYPQGVKIADSKVYLPKIGWLKYIESRKEQGEIKQTTEIKEGKYWYVSFSCEYEKELLKPTLDPEKKIGIDL